MSKTILIVDDDEDLHAILGARLESVGYRVVAVARGSAALPTALSEKPALILLDLMMPGMTGHQVWRDLRQHDELKYVPILILTSQMQVEDKFWGKSMPFEDYFHKPYDAEKLLKRIAQKITVAEKLHGTP